ncbi:MAG: efflux RND transporter periplasmic adaptor subunit [bacterium]|nr:efflux RND transporter periplasmic adaptor subunit [bacterium]
MRKFLFILIPILIIAAVYFVFFRKGNGKEVAPEFTQVNPVRGDISKIVAASGGVTSNLDVEIKCKASGEIVTLPFDISDTVLEGDLLLELDPVDEERNVELAQVSLSEDQARLNRTQENLRISQTDLQTAYEQARVDLEVVQARADNAQASTDRIEDLHNRGFISQEEYEQALTTALASEADVDSANLKFDQLASQEAALSLLRFDVTLASASITSSQINLETAMRRLDYTKVYSPMAGIVTARYVQTGQIISSGISSTSGGTAVMMVSDLSRLYILARVDESDIGKVEIGQRVKVSVDAFSGQNFEGVVDRIAPVGVNVQNVVTFEVRIEITSDNKTLLKPEMTADVEIIVAESIGALMVPSNAVKVEDGKSTIMVEGDGGVPVPREVETGIDNGEFIEIISGLSESDVVLVDQSQQSSMWQNQQDDRRGGPPPGIMFGGRH